MPVYFYNCKSSACPMKKKTAIIPDRKLQVILLLATLLLFAGVIIYRAWLCDDAYITFRVVDNAVHGYKLTWNTDEKVQVYTHPLWMLIQIPIYFFWRDNYLVGMFLCLSASMAAMAALGLKVSRTILGGIMAVLVLTLSNAYVDYSTSGLENPLTHLTLVIFFWITFSMESGNKKLFLLSLVSSLGMMNRMDTALLFFPTLVYEFFKLERKQRFQGAMWVAAGQIPFLIWEVFAILYYGFPFPNTAYAKITGIFPLKNVLAQGMWYFTTSLQYDPITLVIILMVILGVLWKRKRDFYPLVISILLYLAYILYLGGDSYLGRFFTGPLCIAAIILSRVDFSQIRPAYILAGFAGIILLGLSAPMPVYLLEPPQKYQQMFETSGHSRLNYSPHTRLLRDGRLNTGVNHPWADQGIAAREEDPQQVIVVASIGFFGYYAGPQLHVLDPVGLGDALIARLPPINQGEDWVPGHLLRVIPDGYIETIESGAAENQISDEKLAEYFDHLKVITRGKTFSGQRLSEIWKMNTGEYDDLIDFFAYRYPGAAVVDCSSSSCNEGGEPVLLGSSGARLVFNQPVYPEKISFELTREGRYDIELSLDEAALLLQSYTVTSVDNGVLEVGDLPASIKRKGINQIFILPFDDKTPHSLEKASLQ